MSSCLPAADVPSDALSRLTRLTTLTLTGAFVRDFGAGWETKLDCLRWAVCLVIVGSFFELCRLVGCCGRVCGEYLSGALPQAGGVFLAGGVCLLVWLPQVGGVCLFVGLPQVGSLFLLAR